MGGKGMFLFLSKFLPLLVYPLGLACVLIVLALVTYRRRRWQMGSLVLALLLLWLGGNRWVSLSLVRSLEWRYLPSAEMPGADAIVVLGGGTRSAQFPRPTVELNEAGDRVLYAAWLYRQGKAAHILLSGGNIAWLGPQTPAAENMAAILEMMGVPDAAVWLESTSRNTYENGINSREILEQEGIKRILLVTSATHMPRAVRVFERQGLEVIPAPTDFLVTQADWQYLREAGLHTQLINLLPSAGNLELTTLALKEYIGIAVYRLRGWL